MKYAAKGGAHFPHKPWNYQSHGDDWEIEGQEQSPIDINPHTAIPSVTHYLKVWWNNQPIVAEVFDNGHTLLVSC